MYKFIEENFYPQQKFIQSANRVTSIKWDLPTGKITSVSGIKEFPLIFNNYSQNIKVKEQFIFDYVPREYYNKIRYKIWHFSKINKSSLQF